MSLKHFFIRALYFITATALWYFSFWWFAVPFVLFYVYRCRAYELIPLGLLLDMQFLTIGHIPYYTLCFTGAVLAAEWLKPQLRSRTELI